MNNTTLLIPVSIEDAPNYVFQKDDHLWYPYNLKEYGYIEGDILKIHSQVMQYRKENGEIDYCLDVHNFMIWHKETSL